MAMDIHHAKTDINGRWDAERFLRLASFLELTPHEMASMLMIRHKTMDTLIANNMDIRGGNRSLYLLLSIIEQAYMGHLIGDPIVIIPPKHNG